MGVRECTSSRKLLMFRTGAANGVMMYQGATLQQRIPSAAHSQARFLESCASLALVMA